MLAELDRLSADGYRFAALSEERGEIDYGDPDVRVIIDPIDGSLNAKRGISHYALSVAVADGPTMADVAFAFVYDFGPVRGVVGAARRGRVARRRAARPLAPRAPGPRRPARGARDRVRRPALGRGLDRCARRHRLPPARARHDRRDAVPGRGCPLRRDGVARPLARRRRCGRAADRPRGRRPRQLPALRRPARRAARRRPRARRWSPRARSRPCTSSRGSRRDRLDPRRADRRLRRRQRRRQDRRRPTWRRSRPSPRRG